MAYADEYFLTMAIDAMTACDPSRNSASCVLIPLDEFATQEVLDWVRDVISRARRKGGE